MVMDYTLEDFKLTVHNIKNEYNFENIKINKIDNDIFNFKFNEVELNIPIDKFNKIIKNCYGTINYNNNLFKIEKSNKDDTYTNLFLNEEKIEINVLNYKFKDFIKHLENKEEMCSIFYDDKLNQLSLILGFKEDIENFNIHNIFHLNLNLNIQDCFDTIKEIIKYYQTNSNDSLFVYDIDKIKEILNIESNYIDLKDSFNIKNKNNNVESLLEISSKYIIEEKNQSLNFDF